LAHVIDRVEESEGQDGGQHESGLPTLELGFDLGVTFAAEAPALTLRLDDPGQTPKPESGVSLLSLRSRLPRSSSRFAGKIYRSLALSFPITIGC